MTLTFQLNLASALDLAELRLAVVKVIHHHDVLVDIIIRAGRGIAGCDPDSCDQRFVEDDGEKGKARIARRSRDETAEQHFAVDAEVLNQRARSAVSYFRARSAPVRLVNVCENRTEASHRYRDCPVGAGNKK